MGLEWEGPIGKCLGWGLNQLFKKGNSLASRQGLTAGSRQHFKLKNKIKQLNYTLLGGEWGVCDVFDYFLFPETKFIVMFKYNSLLFLLKT